MDQGSSLLRELMRELIKSTGVLEKSDALCCGVTVAQCHAIVEIGREKKLSLGNLSDLLRVDKSTVSRTVDHLVDANLVERDVDAKNRRYISIWLTDKGQQVFFEIEQNMKDYYEGIFGALPKEKQSHVLESLNLLLDAAKNNTCCSTEKK